ncbi:MAG: FixH family protein [Pseudomonadota bacterium]
MRVLLISLILIYSYHANTKAANEPQWIELSMSGNLTAAIFPQDNETIIGQYHNWVIKLNDQNGVHIEDALFSIGGGMEGHGHGLPSQPIVTSYLGEGQYLIEGMLFNMAGDWTLLFLVQTPSLSEKIRFDFELQF